MLEASISVLTITIELVNTFVKIILNINQMAIKVEEEVEIKTLIELTADEEEIKQLAESIEKIPEVESVIFSSKDDELIDLIQGMGEEGQDRKSTRLNSSHVAISYAVFCLKKKKKHE